MTALATAADPLAGLREVVTGLLAVDPATWTLGELAVALPDLTTVTNQLLSLQHQAVASFDARGGAQIAGHRSTADWLATHTRVTPAAAGGMVHTARALRDELPATATALADGEIGADQVRIIRKAHRMFGADFAKIEATVVRVARRRGLQDLRHVVELLIQQYGPDGSEDTAEVAREHRKVHLSVSLDGWWHLGGLLDPASGQALSAALDVYAQRCSEDDTRSVAQRRCDALSEIAARAVDPVDRPTGMGHVTVTLTPEQLDTGLGVSWPSGLLASRTDTAVHTCTASVTYVVGQRTDSVHWQPLAVGFAHRFATKAQRAALAVRDGNGCVHPGCTVPAWRCIAHHIRPWHHAGATDVPNLVLICRYHHRRVHQGRLAITWTGTHYTTQEANKAPPLPRPV